MVRRPRGLSALVRGLARLLPASWYIAMNRLLRHARWGNLRRLEPFGRSYGLGRGTPLDRVYIESFLAGSASRITGRVLEVKDDTYARRFGHDLTAVDVVDIDPGNARANIVGDVMEPSTLVRERYDCVIFTQTLHLMTDPRTALDNLCRSLRPGGALLLSSPVLCVVDDASGPDRWRLTPRALREIVETLTDCRLAKIDGHGNVLVANAFLMGLAAEELAPYEIEHHDPGYPIVVTATVVRGGS